MKIALYVGAFALLIVVVLVAVAASLPIQHTVSRSMRLKKTPSEVFALISGPPNWRPDVKESINATSERQPATVAGSQRRWEIHDL